MVLLADCPRRADTQTELPTGHGLGQHERHAAQLGPFAPEPAAGREFAHAVYEQYQERQCAFPNSAARRAPARQQRQLAARPRMRRREIP